MSIIDISTFRYVVVHVTGEQIIGDISWDEFLHLADLLDLNVNPGSDDFEISDFDGDKIITINQTMFVDDLEIAHMWAKVKIYAKRNPPINGPILSDETRSVLPGVYVPFRNNVIDFRTRSKPKISCCLAEAATMTTFFPANTGFDDEPECA